MPIASTNRGLDRPGWGDGEGIASPSLLQVREKDREMKGERDREDERSFFALSPLKEDARDKERKRERVVVDYEFVRDYLEDEIVQDLWTRLSALRQQRDWMMKREKR
jgi:hypothetical protein